MKISSIKRDTALVNGGAWVNKIPGMGDMQLRVRGQGSDAYAEVFARKLRELPADEKNEDGSATVAAATRISAEAIHETLLIDWAGIEDDEGSPIAFDSDTAYLWLTDPDFKHFLNAVIWAASQVDTGKAKAQEAYAKN